MCSGAPEATSHLLKGIQTPCAFKAFHALHPYVPNTAQFSSPSSGWVVGGGVVGWWAATFCPQPGLHNPFTRGLNLGLPDPNPSSFTKYFLTLGKFFNLSVTQFPHL